ncbi:LOW QUALITY PROTEIN: claudin-22-like [Heliangelus exortis]|uniref:LOW QUALITY PROTEIN: claudin-22-like n=1 Tax=Heliangelus exortis TaxID=472823 RepID=UPI003A8FB291
MTDIQYDKELSRTTSAKAKRLQTAVFLLSVLGSILTATCSYLPDWKNLNLDLNVLELWTTGLWQTCVVQVLGVTQCKNVDCSLALPIEFKISRILVSTSNGLGLLSLAISSLGLDCLKMEYTEHKLKKWLLRLGGTLLWMSGVLPLVPLSWVTHIIIQEFWDEETPEIVPKWEMGDALFSGWFGGFFLILGGSLLFSIICHLTINYQSSMKWQICKTPSNIWKLDIEDFKKGRYQVFRFLTLALH